MDQFDWASTANVVTVISLPLVVVALGVSATALVVQMRQYADAARFTRAQYVTPLRDLVVSIALYAADMENLSARLKDLSDSSTFTRTANRWSNVADPDFLRIWAVGTAHEIYGSTGDLEARADELRLIEDVLDEWVVHPGRALRLARSNRLYQKAMVRTGQPSRR